MKTVFLLTKVPNPRMLKRMNIAKRFGDVEVICVRRLNRNVWEVPDGYVCHVFDMNLPDSKQLVKRAVVSQKFQGKALRAMKEAAPDIIYTEGLDSLRIASKYKRKNPSVRIFYEVADLREIFIETPKSTLGKLKASVVVRTEKQLLNDVEHLVVTSEKFYDKYYRELIEAERVIFQPNIPDLQPFEPYKKKSGGKFTVGFIGGIRYPEQMRMLVDASAEADCRVLFAGAGATESIYDDIKKYADGMENIEFTGRYDYNTQIADLYSRVDCVYSVYDADNPNVCIALPNKLYESVYCRLPILVAKGTYLSELVESLGVGTAVNHKKTEELTEALTKLKNDRDFYDRISENCKNAERELLCGDKYIKALEAAISGK